MQQRDYDVPAHIETLARTAAVAAALRAEIPASEQGRCLTEAAESAMRTAGLYRITTPLGHGGYESGPRTLTASVTALAHAYPSAGWVAAVYLMHTWIAGMFPEQGQAEIFADGPDVRIAGGLAPQGVAAPVEGGWRVNGRWQFGSGVTHADWYVAGASLTTSTRERPRQVHVFVPRREITIEDTWYTMGLRGTGSHDVLLKDVFVPAHRAMSSGALFRGDSEFARRQRTNLYLLPVTSSLALILAAVMLGMARRALELFTEQMKPSTLRYTGDSKAEKAEVQMRLAEADAEIDAAGLIVRDVVERFEALMTSGENAGVALRARTKWQAAYATQLCRRAAERLFAGAGARATMDSSELQRVYRDINQGAHHATIDPDGAAQIHGRVCLGMPPGSYLI
jgi:3-hydroxy-9,10-secoandrosta-1,3,5(10)-triene-9,17-dione monooxygenase